MFYNFSDSGNKSASAWLLICDPGVVLLKNSQTFFGGVFFFHKSEPVGNPEKYTRM